MNNKVFRRMLGVCFTVVAPFLFWFGSQEILSFTTSEIDEALMILGVVLFVVGVLLLAFEFFTRKMES